MFELDEELEAHLYSQIYHSTEVEAEQQNTEIGNLNTVEEDMTRKRSRYFQTQSKNINKSPRGFNNEQQTSSGQNEQRGAYEKDYLVPQRRREISNRMAKTNQRNTANLMLFSNEHNGKNRKGNQKSQETSKDKNKFKKRKQNSHIRFPIEEIRARVSDIISLSESDSDDCIEIRKEIPTYSVESSDDESGNIKKEKPDNCTTKLLEVNQPDQGQQREETIASTSQEDEVIFIQPVIEIINVDEESIEAAPRILKTTPTKDVSYKPNERKDLLNTPDSAASNDFMLNSAIELNQGKFNFSLHGSDFNTGEFLKPQNPADNCESASSSSTTDANNSANAFKTAVFSEVEFPREDLFSEANLESFGSLITPVRKAGKKSVTASTPKDNEDIVPEIENESEGESSLIADRNNKLPDLSEWSSNNAKMTPQKKKKAKKGLNISSKFDFINNDSEKIRKKKKKSKKKKDDADLTESIVENEDANKNLEESSDVLERSVNDSIDLKEKKKKRKSVDGTESVEIENDNGFEKSAKKKKRKQSEPSSDNPEPIISDDSDKKKKRKSTETNDDNVEQRNSPDPPTDNTEQTTNCEDPEKKKKRKSSELSEESSKKKNTVDDQHNDAKELEEPTPFATTEVETVSTEQQIPENLPAVPNPNIQNESLTKIESDNPQGHENNDGQSEADPLDGFIVIDDAFDVFVKEDPETPQCEVILSDSESCLSAINENIDTSDIQLGNLAHQSENIEEASSTSLPSDDFKMNLANSSVQDLLRTMSDDPRLWEILPIDRAPPKTSPKGRRCNRCKEFGHVSIKCTSYIEPKCRLCGQTGHFEPRCSNRICHQCGVRSQYTTTYCKYCFKMKYETCRICNVQGHLENACPDLWRRYHLTTKAGPLVQLQGPSLKPKQQLWCSGCARSGHLEHNCFAYKSTYSLSDPAVRSYEDIYQDANSEPAIVEPLPQQPQPQEEVEIPQLVNPQQSHFQLSPKLSRRQKQRQFARERRQNAPMPINPPELPYPYTQNMGYPYQMQIPPTFMVPPLMSLQLQVPQLPNPMIPTTSYLPNYMSFEDTMYTQQPPPPATVKVGCLNPDKEWTIQDEKYFLNSAPSKELVKFINAELHKLRVMSVNVKNVTDMIKKQYGKSHNDSHFYRTLHMVLFGIFKFKEGKRHLYTLRQINATKSKLFLRKRKTLLKSYLYIFGQKFRDDIPYAHFLERI